MSRDRIYLDYNASAPVRPEARSAMVQWLGSSGNASSVHGEGRAARQVIESARGILANIVGADPQAVTFVSGGTEANVTALTSHWKIRGQDVEFKNLFVSGVEHPSVLSGGRFPVERIEILAVDDTGRVKLDALEQRLGACEGPVLVSVMAANNETGVLQPIREIADRVHAHGGYLHTDAVQAFGKIDMDLAASGADVMTLSAHKIGCVQGVGALIAREGLSIPSLIKGGGQENYQRAGTENVGAIAAFGATLSAYAGIRNEIDEIRRLRDWFEAELAHIEPSSVVFGKGVDRLVNTSCFAIPGLRAETAMISFDLSGIAVSSGSACSSGKVSASHVLKAMGVEEGLAAGAIRVSIGWATTKDDLSTFLQAVRAVCKNQRPQGQTKAA